MKKNILFIFLSIILVCSTSWAETDILPDDLGKEIGTPEGLKKVIDGKDMRFVIVDVRAENTYQMGHIPTAINIPNGFISDIKSPPLKDKYLILYCYGGMTSPAAGERLKNDGYKYIYVWGGVSDWPYELEKSK